MARHLPPVYSPVGLGAIASAAVAGREAGVSSLTESITRHFGAVRIVLTGSGTQALQLAIHEASGPGAAIAMPAYSCYDLVSAAIGADADVRFYDIDPETLTPVLDDVDRCLADGARVLVVGNLYGHPLQRAELRRIATSRGAVLVHDSAQGVGAGAQPEAGIFGDYTVLSFGRGKGWTGGGGGALLAAPGTGLDRFGLSEAVGRLRPSLTSTAAWLLGRPSLYGLPAAIPQLGLGETVYHEPTDPSAISTFSAGLAARTAAPALAAIPARRERARRWLELIEQRDPEGAALRPCVPRDGFDSASCLRFAARLTDPVLTDDRWRALRRLGVETGYPVALPRLEQSGRWADEAPGDFPGAIELAETLVTLPTHHWVCDGDMKRALDLIVDSAPR